MSTADTCTIPTEPSILYAMSGALVEHIRSSKVPDSTLDALVRLAGRLPAEFGVLLMRDAISIQEKRMMRLASVMAWHKANRHLLPTGGAS